jgi:hypothetical protein
VVIPHLFGEGKVRFSQFDTFNTVELKVYQRGVD